jgi:hypothetical protein
MQDESCFPENEDANAAACQPSATTDVQILKVDEQDDQPMDNREDTNDDQSSDQVRSVDDENSGLPTDEVKMTL